MELRSREQTQSLLPMVADIVVIGGGIVGTSIAYHLATMGGGKIILLEREDLLGCGSTGRCAGGFRHQFSTEINIRLSLESVRMILSFEEELQQPVDLHQDGYLFLLTTPDEVEAFRKNISLQNSLGVPSELLGAEEIARLTPHLSLEGIQAGAYCPLDGIGDPNGMTQVYASAARRHGVDIRTGVRAAGIRVARGKVEGVYSGDGFIPCGVVVNAAGPHAREIAAWAGVELPVYPERRHAYTTFPFPQAPKDFLMVIEFTTSFYFHRESGGVLMGMGNPKEGRGFNLAVDPDFLGRLLEVALSRYPGLADAGVNRAWAGLYELSPDAHPILGRVEQVAGFYLANGFSGHGFQHAPVTGKLLAEEILFGQTRTLDISSLRLDRFRTGITPHEQNVI